MPDPRTGDGFDAILVSESRFFDPNATDENFPGSVGLIINKKTYWQGNVEFDTFEAIGPNFGPKWPAGTLKTGGIGMDVDVWGLSDKAPPPEGYDPVKNRGLPNDSDPTRGPGGGVPGIDNPFTDDIPVDNTCYEDDGSPAQADAWSSYIDITLIGAYGGDIKFPVMPENFGADFTHEYWTPRIIGLGEIVMPGGQSMETIQWDSFFPQHYDSSYVSIPPTDLEDPKSLASRLIWTMRFKMNCMLVVGGSIWNDQVVITNFSYKHQAGEPHDIYYSISLKRYRAPTVTTAANPGDVWLDDPRKPVVKDAEGIPTVGSDPNGNEVPITVEPATPLPDDQPFAPGNRITSILIEDTTVQQSKKDWIPPSRFNPNPGPPPVIVPGPPGTPPVGPPSRFNPNPGTPVFRGETALEVSERLKPLGPNELGTLLILNRWITDNGYDPYSTPLNIGEGIKYYHEYPPTAAQAPNLEVVDPKGPTPTGTIEGPPSRFNPNPAVPSATPAQTVTGPPAAPSGPPSRFNPVPGR